MKGLEAFYTEQLGEVSTRIFSMVDCGKIAKSNNVPALLSLIELVIGALVRCPAKETFISRIMALTEGVQAELMYFIQNSMVKVEARSSQEDIDFRKEFQVLQQEQRNLSLHLEELQEALAEAISSQQNLATERTQLTQRIDELEAEAHKQVHKPMTKDTTHIVTELERQVRAKEAQVVEVQTALVEAKKQHAAELVAVKDELDLYKELDIQLSRAESQVELYKKQVEECSVYKRKYKDLQELNDSLNQRIADFNQDLTDAASNKQKLLYYKDQATAEKEEAARLRVGLDEKDKALREVSKQLKDAEVKKIQQKQHIHELLDELDRARGASPSGSENASFTLDRGLEDQLRRLETENKLLKAQLSGSSLIDDLNEQVDKALTAQKAVEQQLSHEQTAHSRLKSQLRQTEQELALAQSQAAQSRLDSEGIQQQLLLQEKETERLQQAFVEFEQLKVERDVNLADIKRLFGEKDQLNSRLFELSEEMHKVKSQHTQAESRVQALETDNAKLKLKAKEAKDSERNALNQLDVLKMTHAPTENTVEKIQYLELQRDLLKVEGQVTSLKLQLKEKEEVLALARQQQERTEAALREECGKQQDYFQTEYEHKFEELQQQLEAKEQALAELSKAKEEVATHCASETKLMSMVIHKVGLEMMKMNRTIDNSWMIRPRKNQS